MTARYHTHVHRASELRADTVLKTLEVATRCVDRNDSRISCWPANADARGRKGLETRDYPQRQYFAAARAAVAAVILTPEERTGLRASR